MTESSPTDVVLVPADRGDRETLSRLLELNAHDLSRFDGRIIGVDGVFGYPYLDSYWDADENRHAFLVRVDGNLAGFALVRTSPENQMAEFFLLNPYRRRGLGRRVAMMVIERFPGQWSLESLRSNLPACALWRSVLSAKTSLEVLEEGDRLRFRWLEPG